MKNTINNQQGAVLLVSMVILVALTMLGVTSMKSSLTELTMAGNLREAGLTFQAAEAGLRTAESIIENSTSLDIFDGTASMLNEASLDPNYLATASWTTATAANVNLSNISTNPRYIIRYLGPRNTNPLADKNISGGYGASQVGTIIQNFRVTSRGSGQTGNFFRVVQSYYGKEY
ncbi:MAG: hypothetical protein ISR69_09095 [Gammaproteobacteria bacterium]|nr:hypothetical protein [Gammaproteobacteria bacterium]